MHLFVFPNAMPRRGEERIKLNIEGTVFHFFHDEEEVIIETALLRDGSSTMVLNNTITGKTYALYNFREILEVLDMTPKEMLRTLSQRGFMQIDKCGGELYVKVFLPEGEAELLSDTTNFSEFRHETVDRIHPLDWQYRPYGKTCGWKGNAFLFSPAFGLLDETPLYQSRRADAGTYGRKERGHVYIYSNGSGLCGKSKLSLQGKSH